MIYLDFDGVLFDTAQEAFIVSCIVADEDTRMLNEADYARFLQARALVTAAWNYRAVMDALDRRLEDVALIGYLKHEFLVGPTHEDRLFEERFFQARRDVSTKDHSAWLALSLPFHFWSLILPLINGCEQKFTILSTKDEASIKEVLTYNGAPLGLRVLGRDAYERAGGSKAAILRNEIFTGEPSLFIDDSFEHIVEVRGVSGVKVFWARWGYVAPNEKMDNSEEAFNEVMRTIGGESVSL